MAEFKIPYVKWLFIAKYSTVLLRFIRSVFNFMSSLGVISQLADSDRRLFLSRCVCLSVCRIAEIQKLYNNYLFAPVRTSVL